MVDDVATHDLTAFPSIVVLHRPDSLRIATGVVNRYGRRRRAAASLNT